VTIQRHIATEKRNLDEVLAFLPDKVRHIADIMARLKTTAAIPAGAKVLDVGAAAGASVAALGQLGYCARGVEPSEYARANVAQLASRLAVTLDVLPGTAENLPFADAEFDVVLANSVLEHVVDLDRALTEAFRVLKPGGVFWFATASAMCPRQKEIRKFPLFGWYPDRLKRRIMEWAKSRKPHLVGFTDHPLVHPMEGAKSIAAGGVHADLRPLGSAARTSIAAIAEVSAGHDLCPPVGQVRSRHVHSRLFLCGRQVTANSRSSSPDRQDVTNCDLEVLGLGSWILGLSRDDANS
jgi:SAM-dependent methyltransferase